MTTSATRPAVPAVAASTALAGAAATGGIGGGLRRLLDYVGVLPFAVFVALFLLWPTAIVVIGAFQDAAGAPTLVNLGQAAQGTYLQTFVTSTTLSAITAAPNPSQPSG